MHSHLSLGTAQWGSGYGATNKQGFLPASSIAAIVTRARAAGVARVDTHRPLSSSQGYGNAQVRLAPWAREFLVTTKVFGAPTAPLSIPQQLNASLFELDVPSVEVCLIHDWHSLSDGEAARAALAMSDLVDRGLTARIGVSTYDREDLDRIFETFPGLTALQVPVSVLDQRLLTNPPLALLDDRVWVQVRSIFLQGILLETTSSTPLSNHPDVQRFHWVCGQMGVDPLVVCISFIKSLPWIDEVIVGVTSSEELKAISRAWDSPSLEGFDWNEFASHDINLLDPRRWNR